MYLEIKPDKYLFLVSNIVLEVKNEIICRKSALECR